MVGVCTSFYGDECRVHVGTFVVYRLMGQIPTLLGTEYDGYESFPKNWVLEGNPAG